MKHILLVEDDLSMLNGLSFAIKKQGYALDIARTRDEQKQLWTEDKYDLVYKQHLHECFRPQQTVWCHTGSRNG